MAIIPGRSHVISATETCSAYQSWHGKQTQNTYARAFSGKRLHYYFYFKDAKLSLVYQEGIGFTAAPFLTTTARWNIGKGHPREPSPRSRKASTA